MSEEEMLTTDEITALLEAPATLSGIRSIVREEINIALGGLVTHDEFEKAFAEKQKTLEAQLEKGLQAERENRAEQVGRVEQQVQASLDKVVRGMERIESNIQTTLTTINNSVGTQGTMLNRVDSRLGTLEEGEANRAKKVKDLDEEVRGYFDRISDDMQKISMAVLGDPKSGTISFHQRVDAISGREALNAEQIEVLRGMYTDIKKSVQSIDSVFVAIKSTWHSATRTTARKLLTAIGAVLTSSTILYLTQNIFPLIVKLIERQ